MFQKQENLNSLFSFLAGKWALVRVFLVIFQLGIYSILGRRPKCTKICVNKQLFAAVSSQFKK